MKHKLKHTLACILALTLLICPALAASSFPDVPDDAPYADAAEYLNEAGIMQGDSAGNFNPDRSVTRAQMAAILCRMLGETGTAKDGNIFSDVPETFWANDTIVKAAELGIIGGYSDGTFRPDNTVTYEQAVTMVVRAMGLEDVAIEYGGYPNGYIEVADEYGFTWGLSVQRGEAMTRGQISILIYRTQV